MTYHRIALILAFSYGITGCADFSSLSGAKAPAVTTETPIANATASTEVMPKYSKYDVTGYWSISDPDGNDRFTGHITLRQLDGGKLVGDAVVGEFNSGNRDVKVWPVTDGLNSSGSITISSSMRQLGTDEYTGVVADDGMTATLTRYSVTYKLTRLF